MKIYYDLEKYTEEVIKSVCIANLKVKYLKDEIDELVSKGISYLPLSSYITDEGDTYEPLVSSEFSYVMVEEHGTMGLFMYYEGVQLKQKQDKQIV